MLKFFFVTFCVTITGTYLTLTERQHHSFHFIANINIEKMEIIQIFSEKYATNIKIIKCDDSIYAQLLKITLEFYQSQLWPVAMFG